MSDIYVVMDGRRLVKASTKQQGAELIRIGEAERLADSDPEVVWPVEMFDRGIRTRDAAIAYFYDRLTIENTELEDDE